jgi:hypothetical protein
LRPVKAEAMVRRSDVPLALAIAFGRPWAYLVAIGSVVGMALLLVWSSGLLVHYRTGWQVIASAQELVSVATISLLFGVLMPLEVAAVTKARNAAGAAGGVAGAAVGILSVSCCAPLLIPSILSFVGFSGTALVTFNLTVRDYMGPLALLSVSLMAVSILLVSRTVTAACAIPVGQEMADPAA